MLQHMIELCQFKNKTVSNSEGTIKYFLKKVLKKHQDTLFIALVEEILLNYYFHLF